MIHHALPRGAAAALLISFAVAFGLAAPAGAATVSGPTTFTFTGSAFKKYKIDVRTTGGKRETDGSTRHVVATRSAAFGSKTTKVRHKGIITLRRKAAGKTRKIVISGIELRLRSKNSQVRARVGGKRMTFLDLDLRKSEFTADRKAKRVKLDFAGGKLTKPAASRIRKALRLKSLPRRSFAVIGTTASPGGLGAPGTGAPATPAPTPVVKPPTAAGVTTMAPLRWHVRESFINYMAAGQGTTVSGGATPGPAGPGGMVYDYDFAPAAGSWFDPATGRGVFHYQGTILFSYKGHGIHATISNPEVHINGASSVMVADTTGSGEPAPTRRTFGTVTLAPGSTAGTAPPRYAFSNMLVEVTEEVNAAVFSGFYPPDDNDFGTLALSFDYAG